MREVPTFSPELQLDAERIFKAQYARALKYAMYMPESDVPTPTEEYLGLLHEYSLPYLPEEVMEALESDWQKECALRLTMIYSSHGGQQSI